MAEAAASAGMTSGGGGFRFSRSAAAAAKRKYSKFKAKLKRALTRRSGFFCFSWVILWVFSRFGKMPGKYACWDAGRGIRGELSAIFEIFYLLIQKGD